MDLSKLTLAELKSLSARIPKELERRAKEEKADLLKEIEALAAKRGFALGDLIGESVKKERAPVSAKYRHPESPEITWTGRGRSPKWVAEFVKNGGNLDQLAI